MPRTALAILLAIGATAGCDDGGGPDADLVEDVGPDADADGDADGDADADADSDALSMPEWEPGYLDPDATVEGLRGYYLIGNALTPGQDVLELTVQAPGGTDGVDAWVDEEPLGALDEAGGDFLLEASIAGLGPGEHHVVLAARGATRAFAALPFVRTHPLYVLVTTDWDDPDNPAETFTTQEELHASHPEMRLTHFLGPYTFTDPSVTEERRGFIVDWLLGMRDTHDDEIGLHIHPWCTFVEAAGLDCITDHSFAYADGDETGYTIYLGDYDEDSMVTLLETADEIFTERGLGKPVTFRAGGWTAELHTLRALATAGYVADTSAMNWARMEEWEGYSGATLYEWNAEQWSSIDETSQPYYPSETDILSSDPPQIEILEVPDNGLMADYVPSLEGIEMFEANWAGGALEEPRQYTIGFHPPNFEGLLPGRIDRTLDHIDQFLASAGAGPVVYATLQELPLVWPLEP